MENNRNKPLGTYVPANGKLIAALRESDGCTQEYLANRCEVSRHTIVRMENDGQASHVLIEAVAAYFGVSAENLILQANPDPLSLPRGREWDPRNPIAIESRRTLPNGMGVRSLKLESKSVAGRFGRGKLYDLTQLPPDARFVTSEMVRRHTNVSELIRSPHVVRCYLCEPDTTARYCFVVDEWLEGAHLDQIKTPIPLETIAQIAHQLLLGLDSMHSKNVICRGLAPRSVLIQTNGTSVITDLEIAKLMDSVKTIRPPKGLAKDLFLAPEVIEQAREIGPSADLFSWAMTVLWMLRITSSPVVEVTASLKGAGVPEHVASILQACLSSSFLKRPQKVSDVSKTVATWASKSARKETP